MDLSTAIDKVTNESVTNEYQALNGSYVDHAPQLTRAALIRVYVLVILGIISLVGNVAIIFHIIKTRSMRRNSRHTWSAIYTLILHLSIADLLVTIFCIFGEAFWSWTVQWIAGEFACKMVKLFQMFALYLSTNVLVLIGIDRWVAVKYPMKSLNMAQRCHRLLIFSYILSCILSLPQYYIFTVSRGPFIEDFYQCVTYGSYSAPWQEQLYTMFTLVFMFIIPLSILLLTYVSTFKTIADSEKIFQANETSNDPNRRPNNRQKLIHRAKMKSLRISVAIIAAFIICWTPYYVLMLIFMFMNPDERFGDELMAAIFFFGMSNSVVNPIIYGAFSLWPVRRHNRKKGTFNNNNNRSSFTSAKMSSDFELVKKVVRALLITEKKQEKNGMPLRTLERYYRESEGRNIPLFGYPDTAALLSAWTDTVYMELYQGQLMIFPVENENTKHVSNLVRNSSNRCRRKPTTNGHRKSRKSQACETISSNGRGKYDRNGDSYQTASNIRNIDTKENTTKPIQSQRKQSNGYGEQMTGIDLDHSSEYDGEHGSPRKIILDCKLLKFNEENIQFEDLPALKFDEIFKTGQSRRVFISQIHSPYKFWLQLNENAETIDTLMNRLEYFYFGDESEMAKTPIPSEYLVIGAICAALYDSQWHRAKIVEVFDYTVKVFYMDYGTVSEIFKKEVRFLGKQFSSQPAFALRGCMDQVRPNEGIWTLEAMNAFWIHMQDFNTAPILAKLTAVNCSEETLYLDLIDTRHAIDLRIADFLVENNFAYPTNKLLSDFQKRHYNEVYPSFERLENGTYPSFQQIKEMKEQNFDFFEYENSIIIPEMYGYETIE